MVSSVEDWLAWAALTVTLASLAWSAHRYVKLKEAEQEHLRYRRFFDIMDMLGAPSGSIASKVAAAYELRKYKEYGDLLERFCRDAQAQVTGESAAILVAELRRTTEYFEESRGRPR